MSATFGPGLPPPGSRPVEFAMARVGQSEITGMPNRGPLPDQCLRFVGVEPDREIRARKGLAPPPPGGYPWCCAFAVLCCWEGGAMVPKTASVSRLVELIPGREIEAPEIGCLIAHLPPKGNHILFCTALNEDGTLGTVSGNTSAAGEREGKIVGLHDKPRSYCTKFFHVDADPFRRRP